MNSHDKFLREELRNFICEQAQALSISVSLTLKQGKYHQDGVYEELTREAASKNVTHFLRKLNQCIYRNAFHRYGKRLKILTVIESGSYGDKRLHVHMALEFPPYMCVASQADRVKFYWLIRDCWRDTRWGHSEVDYTVSYDSCGWIFYITKEGVDSVDLKNTWL